MKHFYTAILFLALSLCASAEAFRSMAVNLTDGTKVEINLSEELRASFSEDDLVVSGGETDITIPRKSIKSFTFSQLSSLEGVGTDATEPVIEGGVMSFTALPEGTAINVYNVAGALLFSAKASGDYVLDLSKLSASPVIVTVNEVAYKIATK